MPRLLSGLFLLSLIAGCGNEGERGMNKDKGFPKSDPVQAKKAEVKKAEDKKAEDKKAEDKKAEDKKAEDKKAGDKK